MRVLDLFSGIGGFSLGLERAGMTTVAFCEIEPYAQAVLRKHWPNVPCYDDIRQLTAARLAADGIAVDLICGGFPCQDISCAGNGAGIEGARSGLWREYSRLIGELRPRFVIVENVAALLGRGLGVVLGDLAALGFDAEWHCIPASAVGAPHRRDRIWCVAWHADGVPQAADGTLRRGTAAQSRRGRAMADANGQRAEQSPWRERDIWLGALIGREMLAYAHGIGCEIGGDVGCGEGCSAEQPQERREALDRGWWRVEPDVGRVAHGVPARVDRLKGLGNAVVPQIPEIIGRAILASEAGT